MDRFVVITSRLALQRALIIACLLLQAILFYLPLVLGGKTVIAADLLYRWYPWATAYPDLYDISHVHNPVISDPVNLIYPLWLQASRTPEITLWDPFILAGSPMQIIAWYWSISIPRFIGLSLPWASTISMIVHSILAVIGMYMFSRACGISIGGALVASGVYAWNIYSLTWLEFEVYQRVLAWVPFSLLLLYQATQGGRGQRWRLLNTILAAITIYLIISCGNLQLALYGLAIIGAFAAFISIRRQSPLPLTLSILAIVIGIGLGAIYILHQYHVLAVSSREPTYLATLLPQSLLTLISPNIFGTPVANTWRIPSNYNEQVIYVGVVTLIMVSIGWISLPLTWRLVSALVVLVILGYAISIPAINAIVYRIPVVSQITPSRAPFMLVPLIALLSGKGAEVFAARLLERVSVSRIVTVMALLFLSSIIVTGLTVWILGQSAELAPLLNSDQLRPLYLHGLVHPYRAWVAFIILIPLMSLVKSRFIIGVLISMLVLLDLWPIGWSYNSSVPEWAVYPVLPEIEYIAARNTYWRVAPLQRADGAPSYPPNTLAAYGIQTTDGYGSFIPRRYRELKIAIDGRQSAQRPDVISMGRPSKFADLLSVGYVLATDEQQLPETYEEVYRNAYARVYFNHGAAPRAAVVCEVEVARSSEEALKITVSDERIGRRAAVVELSRGDGAADGILGEMRADYEGCGTAEIVAYEPQYVRVEISAKHGALLVLNDLWDEGWRATVDGKETEIAIANYIVRGVFVGQGPHVVEFRYDPSYGRWAQWISRGTLIFMICVVASGVGWDVVSGRRKFPSYC